MRQDTATPMSAATDAIERGWSPLPLPRGSKRPKIEDWPNLRYRSVDELEEAFGPETNIGLLLGAPSGGLVDIDLDSLEARILADAFLPYTGMVHGRESSPASHRWYLVNAEVATKRYQAPKIPGQPAGETLIELRSTGGQTVIPPSIHPNGERIEWEGDELKPSKVSRVVLKRAVRELAAGCLLTRNWPAKGGRHDASLALAGGLMLSGWKPKPTWRFILEIARAAGDEEANSRRGDVATTARRILSGRKVQGWPTLAKLIGPEIVDCVREWLELSVEEVEGEPGEVDADDLRNRRDVGLAIQQGIPEPEMVVTGVLYAGRVTWWTGEPGAGKTLIALKFARDLIHAGHKVMLVDEESGLALIADRLKRFSVDPEKASSHFIYYEFPALTTDDEDLSALFRVIARELPRLVIFDSAADLLRQAGIDEDDNIAVTGWIKDVLEPLANEYGAAVLVIDHVTKSNDNRKWARGAGAKKAKAKVGWNVEKIHDFSIDPPQIGTVRLRKTKDTPGRLPARHDVRIGGKADGTSICEVNTPKISDEPMKLEDVTLGGRIKAWLRKNAAGEENAVGVRQIREAVKGKSSAVRPALDDLVSSNNGVRVLEDERGYARYYSTMEVTLDFEE